MLIGTPEELKARQELWAFLVRNTTESGITLETWADGLDRLKVYVSRYLFPGVTLPRFLDQEIFKHHSMLNLLGETGLFREQGYFEFIERGEGRNIIWGLTRRGSWVVGSAHMVGLEIKSLTMQSASSKQLIEAMVSYFGDKPLIESVAFIAKLLKEFIEKDIREKRTRLHELERAFGSVDTFSGIVSVKAESREG